MAQKKPKFEASMEKLEQIVQELEQGELPLEVALKKFEEGVQLAGFCSKTLDETEKKVIMLLKDQNGEVTERPFIEDHPSADADE